MAFIPYLEKPEEWDLQKIVEEELKEKGYKPQEVRVDRWLREPSAWLRERMEEQFREQLRKQIDERAREYIPDDIEEAIRNLREAGWLPAQQRRHDFGWVRELFADVGFLIIFLVFVLLAGVYLGQRTLFYILSLILLSIIIVNADKFRRMIELLKGVVT